MIKPILLRQNYLLLAGLFMLAAGLPLSKFLTGFSQVVLAASFFLEGNFTEKLRRLKQNKIIWILCGIWLVHLAGLIHTENMVAGLWDARMKIPILILAITIGSASPLPSGSVKKIMQTFIFSVLLGTLISTAVLAGIIYRPIDDIRDIFIFHISHIRFALFVCLSIFYIAWQLYSESNKMAPAVKYFYYLLIAWLVVFLFLAESITGLAILFVLSIPALIAFGIHGKSRRMKILVLGTTVLFPALVLFYTLTFLKEINKPHETEIHTEEKTALGNPYRFNLNDSLTENGYRIWIYFNHDEMRAAWNTRSRFPYDSLDKKSQPLGQTLIRYLTSLGWRKDAAAVEKLSAHDVLAVESGIANCHYTGTSNFKARLMELNWEYQQAVNNQNPSGHSATMRLEFWKTGWQIFKDNFWTGVGTGDLQLEYNRQYEKMKTTLSPQWRLRAHNQYLSIGLALGIFGLLYFLFALIYPALKLKKHRDFVYTMFLGIFLLSMLTEDTLETPAGAAFFGFFNSLFLFSKMQADSGEHPVS